ncbi:MAG: D-alanyl-D-alanine carboxypeptidase family protein [Candidatus Gracilibacteria bacterium]
MNKKTKVVDKNHFNIYGVITLVILIIYIIGLAYFLLYSHRQIKNIYTDIEKKQLENNFLRSEIIRLKEEKADSIFNLDLETDNSIYKFVTSSKAFNDIGYIPENLEKIGSKFVYDTKGGRQLVTSETNEALQKIGEAFYGNFNKKISIVSAYRSYAYQEGIKRGGCPDNLCAKAGFSEHQSGLAVDIWEVSTNRAWMNNSVLRSYYDWFNINAHTYGFTNTYQKGLLIDGYEIEPWHWRYIGIPLATYLKENNLTVAEFYNSRND